MNCHNPGPKSKSTSEVQVNSKSKSKVKADIFEEQHSKRETYYSNVYDLGGYMFHLNDCLCLYYCSEALNITFLFIKS